MRSHRSVEKFVLTSFIFVSCCVGAGALSAQSVQPGENGAVFVVNLWSQAVDIQYGDKPEFSFSGLAAGQPSAIVETVNLNGQPLYFKPSSEQSWRFYQDDQGKPGKVYVFPFVITIIKINSDGSVSVFRTPKPQGDLSFVAFLNASDQNIDLIKILNSNQQAFAQATELPGAAISSFVGIVPGSYGAVASVSNSMSETSGADAGSFGLVTMSASSFYLVFANTGQAAAIGSDETKSGGPHFDLSIWNLGPLPLENIAN